LVVNHVGIIGVRRRWFS